MSGLFVRYRDPTGTPEIATFREFVRVEWSRKENEVGVLDIDLPPIYDLSIFKLDGRLEIWREVAGRLFLEGETIFFLRDWQYSTASGQKTLHLKGFDANYLLGYNGVGRIVPYNDLAYVEKVATCDDMMKDIVRENMGALALDTTRDLSTYLSVEVDRGLAYPVHKAFAQQCLLNIFQELATVSLQGLLYLAFDIVYTGPVMLEFRTYVGQRGNDHRCTSDQPVIINQASKSLEDPVLDFDHTDEVSFVYAGGAGTEALRPIDSMGDANRIGLSPFNRREQFVDASQTEDADELRTETLTALAKGRPKKVLTGKIIDTDQLLYGLHYGFGDIVVAEYDGYSFDAHLDTIHGIYENGVVVMDNHIRGEL
jgi:hypothetical protein